VNPPASNFETQSEGRCETIKEKKQQHPLHNWQKKISNYWQRHATPII